jgi:hypothetical protein
MGGRGCSTWSKAAAETPCPAGFLAATKLGGDRIAVAALDPFRGYTSALRTTLPQAIRVLDAFHVVRLALRSCARPDRPL